MLVLKRYRIRRNHSDFGLLNGSTFTSWLLLGSLIFLRRVWVLIVRPLINHTKGESDFFWLLVRFALDVNLVRAKLSLFSLSEWSVLLGSFWILFRLGVDHLFLNLRRDEVEEDLIRF